jgi:murein DD-endopeptidase MepM/ murein hydrolase activator NlpD
LVAFFSPISLAPITLIKDNPILNGNHQLAFGPLSGVLQAPDFYLVQKDSIRAFYPVQAPRPQVLADLVSETGSLDTSRQEIIEYLVKEGDTISSLAGQFDVSPETILWANSLDKNSVLAAGKKLVILPVSGVMHVVRAGETLSEIVGQYKADLQETLAFNDLENENQVFIGDIVIVPGGTMPEPVIKRPAPTSAPLTPGYFVCPIAAPCRLTQGLHWYNAVDLSHGQCGEPIYAAASGTVQKVMLTSSTFRWVWGGAGNHLTILHPNGVVTYYGHLASALVSAGQEIVQGQIIGYMGGEPGMPGAGKSTGCHVHFQVIGARNPLAP